jgi:hypothetical protein
MNQLPAALVCVDTIGAESTPAEVEAVCQVVAALEMADPGELPAASWALLASEAAAKLPPANPSRVLLVEQIIESSWSAAAGELGGGPPPAQLAASGRLVRETAFALALGRHRRSLSTIALVAAAAKLLGGRRLAATSASLLGALEAEAEAPAEAPERKKAQGPGREPPRVLRDWEWEAIASAVGQLATDEFACASVAALRLAVSASRPAVSAPSQAFLLREIMSAAPRLASAICRQPAAKRAACAEAVCWSASTLYLSGDRSATRQVCCLLTVARTALSDRGAKSGPSVPAGRGLAPKAAPRLHAKSAVRALACLRLREQVAARNARDASLSVLVLQQIRSLDRSFDDRCIGSDAGCAREADMWTGAVELAASLVADGAASASDDTRGECLASLCAGFVMGLVSGSPLFAARAHGNPGSGGGCLGRALWSLADALRTERHKPIAENVAESLFFIHAWDDDDDGAGGLALAGASGAAMFAAHLRKDLPATLLVPFARSCCRLAGERGDKPLAAETCSELAGVLQGRNGAAGRSPPSTLSTSDACKALGCLRQGWTPAVAAAELARAVIAAMDPLKAATDAPARIFDRLAPWLHLLDEAAARKVTDIACAAVASSEASSSACLLRAAVRCLAARPLPEHRGTLESAMDRALAECPDIFPELVAAFAHTFDSPAAEAASAAEGTSAAEAASASDTPLLRRLMRRSAAVRGTREAVDRVVGKAAIGAEAQNAAWWAGVVIENI